MHTVMQLGVLTIFSLLLFAFVAGDTDPCLPGDGADGHVIIDSEYQRSMGYEKPDDEDYICDRYSMHPGWYRFTGHQGGDMSTEPVQNGMCGTAYPVWLNGDIPAEADDIVDRQACAVGLDNATCYSSYDIRVKNCGDFRVYELDYTDSCPSAYCIGTEVPCPNGTYSLNMYTPDCIESPYPVYDNDPWLTWRVDEGSGALVTTETGVQFTPRKLVMQCNHEHDEDIFYDVNWYLDDQLILIGDDALASADMPAEFSEDLIYPLQAQQGIAGSTINCTVEPLFHRNWFKGEARSASHFIGFELVSGEELTVEEGGDAAQYVVRPTVPVLCPIGFDECTLPLEVHVPQLDDGTPAVCNGEVLDQAMIMGHTSCRVEIPMTLNTSTTFAIDVLATTDNMYDGNHDMVLDVRTSPVHPSHWIWQDYALPQAKVYVMDNDVSLEAKICTAKNDPHMTTFDGRIYENQLEGAFILYKHKTLPIEVHAYFAQCTGYATCVCGAAIRAGQDLFIYDTCLPESAQRVNLAACEDHMLQIEDLGSDRYRVTLPTGTQVLLWSNYISVVPSLADYGQTEGLCGSLDGDCGNEFIKPDGSTSFHEKATQTSCDTRGGYDQTFHPNDFNAAWRVRVEDSLYNGTIPSSDSLHANIYCGCPEEGPAVCNFGASPTIENCVQSRYDVTERYFGRCSSRKRRDVATSGLGGADDVHNPVPLMFPHDPDFAPEPPKNLPGAWTKEYATQWCVDYYDVKAVHVCNAQGVINVPSAIQSCMIDIMLCDCKHFAQNHLEDMLRTCEREVTRNMTLYSYNTDSGTYEPPREILKHLCPVNCGNQGSCVNGVCECDEGYIGEDCLTDKTRVPELYDLPQGGRCDQATRPCLSTPVEADEFHNVDTLTCRAVAETGETEVSAAEFDHRQRVMCALPEVDAGAGETVVLVAVANDGYSFSAPKQLVVFNSNAADTGRRTAGDSGSLSEGVVTWLPGIMVGVVTIAIVVAVVAMIIIKKSRPKRAGDSKVSLQPTTANIAQLDGHC